MAVMSSVVGKGLAPVNFDFWIAGEEVASMRLMGGPCRYRRERVGTRLLSAQTHFKPKLPRIH
jgi:hypothetical protein